MRIFAVDKNNDLYLGADGSLAMKNGLLAFMQACEHAMQSLLGEMPFAQGRGLPFKEAVWTGTPDLRLFEESARTLLLSLEGATSISEFYCEVCENTLKYRAVIRSVYGTAAIGATNG